MMAPVLGSAADRLPRLREAAAAQLSANWREGATPEGVEYGYTRPDTRKFPDQFFWDSCLHAVAWRHLDPARARRELRTLLAAQRPDGLIGHTVFWHAPVRLARRHTYNLLHHRDRATATIQPPLLAWAWAEVAERSPDDPGFAREGLAGLLRYHDWLDRERAEPDGLLRIIQPDESGMDATPAYDGPLGRSAHPSPGFVLMMRANRGRGFDYRRTRAAGGFNAVDVLVNMAWALSWEGLARLGHAGARDRAEAITAEMVARLWDPDLGFFFPRGPDDAPLGVSTWAGLAPLALPTLPEEVGRRLVEEHLLSRRRYWLPFPVPSASAEEPSFRPGRVGHPIERYWRGPTWLFSTRFILEGLLRLGYRDAAAHLARRTAELVLARGFHEYYNPISGRGHGGRGFAVSTMALDCLVRAGEG